MQRKELVLGFEACGLGYNKRDCGNPTR